jgi:hypothetical protein
LSDHGPTLKSFASQIKKVMCVHGGSIHHERYKYQHQMTVA